MLRKPFDRKAGLQGVVEREGGEGRMEWLEKERTDSNGAKYTCSVLFIFVFTGKTLH